jgi:hypothetical protein
MAESGKPKRKKSPPKPAVNFADIEFKTAERPASRGYAPMLDIHNAVLATHGTGTSVQVKTPPDVPAFLAQMRSTLRKNGHKVRVAKSVNNGTMSLWAEEPRERKPRKAKV